MANYEEIRKRSVSGGKKKKRINGGTAAMIISLCEPLDASECTGGAASQGCPLADGIDIETICSRKLRPRRQIGGNAVYYFAPCLALSSRHKMYNFLIIYNKREWQGRSSRSRSRSRSWSSSRSQGSGNKMNSINNFPKSKELSGRGGWKKGERWLNLLSGGHKNVKPESEGGKQNRK